MPSENSSPDETCVRCTHPGSAHDGKGCHPDPGRHECNCRAFVPAEPARLDPDCIRPTGCRDKLKRGCNHGCAEAADELTRLDQEMEPTAPECGVSDACTYAKGSCGKECQGVLDAIQRAVQAPPRPPFLVAYATGSGALNELALPGEASVAVVDGSLVISHASGVLGIASVKPLELEN